MLLLKKWECIWRPVEICEKYAMAILQQKYCKNMKSLLTFIKNNRFIFKSISNLGTGNEG